MNLEPFTIIGLILFGIFAVWMAWTLSSWFRFQWRYAISVRQARKYPPEKGQVWASPAGAKNCAVAEVSTTSEDTVRVFLYFYDSPPQGRFTDSHLVRRVRRQDWEEWIASKGLRLRRK